MITDDRLRAAFERQAGRAPDPDRVLSGFQARAARARRRRRTIVVVGTAAAAALAITVPAITLGGTEPSARNPDPKLQGQSAAVAYPFPYGPAWLPTGFREVKRQLQLADGGKALTRVWQMPRSGREISLTFRDRGVWPIPQSSDIVQVNGHQAERLGTAEDCTVSWRQVPGHYLEVESAQTPGNCSVALRVARSLTSKTMVTLESRLRFGWLPSRPEVTEIEEVTARGCETQASVAPSDTYTADTLAFQLKLSRGVLPKDGLPVKVASRPARKITQLREGEPASAVVVDLSGGRLLTVSGGLGGDDTAIRLASTVNAGPLPTCAWSKGG